MSSQLLTSLGRLFTTFLKGRGFTIGVRDIMCVNQVRVVVHADRQSILPDFSSVCLLSGYGFLSVQTWSAPAVRCMIPSMKSTLKAELNPLII